MYNILVAEDELLERKVLCKFLKRSMEDRCTVLEAGNGREAVELFEQYHPAVAILDIRMPGLTGLEAARIIRQSGKPCVILFLTAFDKFEYAREVISLRAMDYLLKPYSEQELLLSVEEALHLYERMAADPLAQMRGEDRAGAGEEEEGLHRLGQIREDIVAYIWEHYTEELSMQDVARAMNYSDAYFCKLFKQCFKVNFSAWLNEFRVEKAKELLSATWLSVREVSLACGYADANYFARVFKRITGMTPSEYRSN